MNKNTGRRNTVEPKLEPTDTMQFKRFTSFSDEDGMGKVDDGITISRSSAVHETHPWTHQSVAAPA